MSEINGKLINGVYIPARVSDELKARFLAGSIICIQAHVCTTHKWKLVPIHHYGKNEIMTYFCDEFAFASCDVEVFEDEGEYMFAYEGKTDEWRSPVAVTLNEFEKICQCLEKNC